MNKEIFIIVTLIFIIFVSGCIGGINPEDIAKNSPLVQDFLEEHPNAEVKIVFLSEDHVEQIIEEIRQECDNPYLEAKDFYRVIVDDKTEGLYVVSWIDWENKRLDCAVKKGILIEEMPETCNEGETTLCGNDIGICKSGIRTCIDGEWSECIGFIGPDIEVCDSLDNDCDGEIDEGVCDRIATGFTTLGAPGDWDFDSNGDFSIILNNRLAGQITISRVEITLGSKTDSYEPSTPFTVGPGSSYTLYPSESGLNLGLHTSGAAYSIEVKIEYVSGTLPHTETGRVTGTVSEATTTTDESLYHEGTTKTVTLEGMSFQVSLIGVSDTDTVMVKVNEESRTIDLHQNRTISALNVYVDEVNFFSKEGQVSSANLLFSI